MPSRSNSAWLSSMWNSARAVMATTSGGGRRSGDGGCGSVVTESATKTVHENAGRFGWEQVGDKDFCKHCKSKAKKEARKP